METSNNQSTTFTNAASQVSSNTHDELWIVAKRRANFKRSLFTYIVMNCFFVAIWYFTSGYNSYYWPIWPMIGWGFGILMQYIGAYQSNNLFSTEEEYEKLKKAQHK
jgi:hypothetical protein